MTQLQANINRLQCKAGTIVAKYSKLGTKTLEPVTKTAFSRHRGRRHTKALRRERVYSKSDNWEKVPN